MCRKLHTITNETYFLAKFDTKIVWYLSSRTIYQGLALPVIQISFLWAFSWSLRTGKSHREPNLANTVSELVKKKYFFILGCCFHLQTPQLGHITVAINCLAFLKVVDDQNSMRHTLPSWVVALWGRFNGCYFLSCLPIWLWRVVTPSFVHCHICHKSTPKVRSISPKDFL